MHATNLDPFLPSGHPLHTRSLVLEAFQEDASTLRAEGAILDLRKCGFVPTGGELQTSGFIHQMRWRVWIQQPSARITRLEVEQPSVAMEASPATGGECCRDPAPRLQALVGSVFDEGFGKRLVGVFGGPLGCSHLLSTGQSLASFVPRVIADERRTAAGRAPGERIAKQTLMIDGFERPGGELSLALQLASFRLAPLAACRDPLARLAACQEIRVLGEVALEGMQLRALAAAARARTPENAERAAWRSLGEVVAPLVGGSALRGMAPRVFACLAAMPAGVERALLTETLLNFAPGLIQCMAALSHRLSLFLRPAAARGPEAEPGASALLTSGGFPDSCYMWRTGGAASRTRSV
jgi:hypothetical protein